MAVDRAPNRPANRSRHGAPRATVADRAAPPVARSSRAHARPPPCGIHAKCAANRACHAWDMGPVLQDRGALRLCRNHSLPRTKGSSGTRPDTSGFPFETDMHNSTRDRGSRGKSYRFRGTEWLRTPQGAPNPQNDLNDSQGRSFNSSRKTCSTLSVSTSTRLIHSADVDTDCSRNRSSS